MTKAETISRILKITGKEGQELYFDKLIDKKTSYLNRLLKAIEKLTK